MVKMAARQEQTRAVSNSLLSLILSWTTHWRVNGQDGRKKEHAKNARKENLQKQKMYLQAIKLYVFVAKSKFYVFIFSY
jgi:nitrogen regulatory protein PII